jgi:hypothetical protein
MPATAGILAKVMKPTTACREDNNNIDTINMRWQQQQEKRETFSGGFFGFFSFYVRYSTLLYLPPLRFHCVGGCWN